MTKTNGMTKKLTTDPYDSNTKILGDPWCYGSERRYCFNSVTYHVAHCFYEMEMSQVMDIKIDENNQHLWQQKLAFFFVLFGGGGVIRDTSRYGHQFVEVSLKQIFLLESLVQTLLCDKCIFIKGIMLGNSSSRIY